MFLHEAFCRKTGYRPEEVLGGTPRLLQGPKTDRTMLARIRRELSRGQPVPGFVVNYRKDGSEFTIDWQISPVRDASGAITHFVAAQRDITARLRAEEIRHEREEGFRLLFASNPAPMWVFDRVTLRFLEVNAAAAPHYGYSREEFLGMTIADIRPARDRGRLERAMARCTCAARSGAAPPSKSFCQPRRSRAARLSPPRKASRCWLARAR